MACDPELLADVELFEMMSDEDRATLAAIIDLRELKEGDVLYRAGEPGESLFVVRHGKVERTTRDTTGKCIQLSVHDDNDIFGELALTDRVPRVATATALDDSELLELDRDDLLVLFDKNPRAALRLLAALSAMTRKVDELLRKQMSRNVNEEVEEHHTTVLQHIADWIAWFSGSMPFLLLNLIWFVVWIVVNTTHVGVEQFDPYPFGLLTMIVSLEAIFLSCFVLISQNRQAEKDRVRSDIEYDINIKAELEIAHLHEKADRMYEDMLERFARLETSTAKH
jgi:uncharacterized membrane protein